MVRLQEISSPNKGEKGDIEKVLHRRQGIMEIGKYSTRPQTKKISRDRVFLLREFG